MTMRAPAFILPAVAISLLAASTEWSEIARTVACTVANEVDILIQRLSSSSFADREAATKRLLQMGKTPIDALEKTLKSDDPDLCKRAEGILHALRRRMSDQVQSVALSPDATVSLVGMSGPDGSILIFRETTTNRELLSFTGHDGILGTGAISADRQLAVTAGRGSRNSSPDDFGDCSVRLWNLKTGREIRRFVGHRWPVSSASFSPDMRRIISSGLDSTVRVWDLGTARELACYRGHTSNNVCQATFSPDGKLAASGGTDGTVRIWEAETARELQSVPLGQLSVHRLAFSPDGRKLVASTGIHRTDRPVECVVWLIDARSGEIKRRFEGHSDYVHNACFTPNGKRVVSVARDRTVRVWDLETGNEMRQFRTKERLITFLAVSSDSRTISTLSYNGVFEQFDMPP
jgi:WD40 repeat protein